MDIKSTGNLLDYQDFVGFSLCLIETGSGHGAGIQRALDAGFIKVTSIEAQEENFQICVRRFFYDRRVRMILGRSQYELARVLSEDRDVERFVIFLDAHPSGENSYGHKEWAEGDQEFFQESIILKELDAIMKDSRRHLIILDDINGTEDGLAKKYCDIIRSMKDNYRFFFYDEHIGSFYKDKLLVCVPGEYLE